MSSAPKPKVAAARGAGFRNRMIRNAEVQEASYWIPKGLIMVGMYLEAAQQEQQAQLDNEEQSFVQSISQGSTEAERRALQLKLRNAGG